MKKVILLMLIMTSICLFSFSQKVKTVAVLNPAGPVDENIKLIVREEISSVIVSSNEYTVSGNNQLDKIPEENILQISESPDNSRIGEIGKEMGADYVCVTNISAIGTNFYISCKLINVHTTRIEIQKTGKTSRGFDDIDLTILEIAGEMFNYQTDYNAINTQNKQKEKEHVIIDRPKMLIADEKDIFYQGRKLEIDEVKNLYKNMDALRLYEKGVSQNRTGNTMIGLSSIFMGIGVTGIILTSTNNNVVLGVVFMSTGFPVGGVLLGRGIGTKSSGKRYIKRSVNSYNEETGKVDYKYENELRFGLTQNGIGVSFSF